MFQPNKFYMLKTIMIAKSQGISFGKSENTKFYKKNWQEFTWSEYYFKNSS